MLAFASSALKASVEFVVAFACVLVFVCDGGGVVVVGFLAFLLSFGLLVVLFLHHV